jgi:hypothetical protein
MAEQGEAGQAIATRHFHQPAIDIADAVPGVDVD